MMPGSSLISKPVPIPNPCSSLLGVHRLSRIPNRVLVIEFASHERTRTFWKIAVAVVPFPLLTPDLLVVLVRSTLARSGTQVPHHVQVI